MEKWEYQDLENDIDELTQNLLSLNQQNTDKANKSLHNLKIEKSEKKLRKTVLGFLESRNI